MLRSCSRSTAHCISTPGTVGASSRLNGSRDFYSARLDLARPKLCRRTARHSRIDASIVKSTDTVTCLHNAKNGAEVQFASLELVLHAQRMLALR